MNLALKSLSALLFTAIALVLGNAAAVASDKYVGLCNVVFKGNSTLDAFAGDITNIALTVICDTNSTGQALLNTRIEIGPRQLVTHNNKRDANMYQMFASDRFPILTMIVTNAPLDAARLAPTGSLTNTGIVPVQLTICGITNEVRGLTLNQQALAEGWEFDLQTDISLKEFKLQPPTLLLGAISVRDIVKVNAHVKLQKEPP